MLFSNPRISALVRGSFHAAWESVRPVPKAEIDFGNGTKITRTLNGNIATYLCAPDGRVLDIIPGLCSPEAYLEGLGEALTLFQAAFSPGADVEKILRTYHAVNVKTPSRYIPDLLADVSKGGIEKNLRYALRPVERAVDRSTLRKDSTPKTEEEALLELDTRINREERQPLVHRILSEGVVRPAQITKRVYREVLHCDLDDPYLGLVTRAFGGGAYEER